MVVLVHVTTSEDELRVVGRAHGTIEQLAIRLIGVDILPTVGPVLVRELSIVRRSDALRILATLGLVVEAIGIEVVDTQVNDILTGSSSACPLRFVVGQRQQRRAVEVLQLLGNVVGDISGMLSVLQLTVGQRRSSISEHNGTGGQGGSDGGTHHVALVAAVVLQFLRGLQHLVGDVGGALLIGRTWRSQLVVLQRVVGTFVGHDGHRSELTEQQPVIVGTHEAGLTAVVLYLILAQLIVYANVVDEDRSLVDALIAAHPGILAYSLGIVALAERVVRSIVGILGVTVCIIAVAIVHVVGKVEGIPVAAVITSGTLGADLEVAAVEERVGMCQPGVGLNLVGEDALQGLAVAEVFIRIKIGAAGCCCGKTAAHCCSQQ